jgi:tRNA threonylcarbamoyladenosine modification (KEOPS) complex  Pcc1 subunit
MYRATLEVECKNPTIIEKSLLPDIKNKEDLRIKLKTTKRKLIIEVESKKISYLKAIINSYLSLIKTLEELEESTW